MTDLIINSEQKKAITYDEGPLLVVAGAGTGKTTVITERIRYLLSTKKASPKEILALTFTDKAAAEMLKRVDEIMPLGYDEPWLFTFHAFCDRLLQDEALEIGLDPTFKILSEPEQWLLIRKHLFEFDLKHYRPLGNPTKFISNMLLLFSRAKDEIVSSEDYLKYANKLKKGNDDAEIEEREKTIELANAYQKYQELLLSENALDFGDLLLWTIKLFKTRPSALKKYQQQFKYILVDEFQDTNFAQFEIIKLLAPREKNPNLLVVGDDDQCLPAGTLIHTQDGPQKIETLKEGQLVLSGVGRGQVSLARINKILRSTKKTRVLTIRTASGKKLAITNNHKVFCYINPDTRNQKRWYVYLMEQKNLGWRIGITKNIAIRSRFERQVDRVFGICSFNTLEDAKFHELLYSLKYHIPTITFTIRQKQLIKNKLLQNLMVAMDTETGARRLARDLHVDLKSHHFSPGGVFRGNTHRVKITIIMCQRRHKTKNARNRLLINPKITHALHLETDDKEIIEKLENEGFKLQKAKVGRRFRLQSKDLGLMGKILKKIEITIGGIVEVKCQIGIIGKYTKFASVIPASNLLVGMYLPVFKNNEIHYDQIVDIKEKNSSQTVYDLEVDTTHNYIANGIVVHNSIYKFRGAAISNILDFRRVYPKSKTVVLTQNYRSTQKILDSSYELIQNNNPDRLEVKIKINKKLKSARKKTGVYPLVISQETMEDEAEIVKNKILSLVTTNNYSYASFAVLARANNHLDSFVSAFKRAGIPYSLLGNRGLFDQEEIRILISFLRFLAHNNDNVSLYQLMTSMLYSFAPDDITLILSLSHQQRIPLWEALNNVSKTNTEAKKLIFMIENLKTKVHFKSVTQLLYEFVMESSLVKNLALVETIENSLRIKNINLFFDRVKDFETQYENPTVFEFVDYLDLLIEAGENPAQAEIEDIDTVKLLTVHAAKGLEFPVVFLANLVEDRFPSRLRSEPLPLPETLIKETLPKGNYHLEEERRLFYVGMTRSRDYLFLSFAKNYGGVREKKPSIFINELKDKFIREENPVLPAGQIPLLTPKKYMAKSGLKNIVSEKGAFLNRPVDLKFVSYSQLETFKTCPLKYYYKYVLGVMGIPNFTLNFGQTLHRTLRDFHKADLFSKTRNIDELLYLYKSHFAELSSGYTSIEHRKESFKHGLELLEKYFKIHRTLFGKPVFLEQRFKIKVGGISLIGAIDRIDQYEDKTYEVIDYKTGENLGKKEKVDHDEQLTIYALAANEALGINPKNYTLYFLEKGLKATTQRETAQIQKQKEEVENIIEEIKKGNFPAKVGMWCQWCEFNKICPAYKIGRNSF